MGKRNGFYPVLKADVAPVAAVGHAGGVLLAETARTVGLDVALARALAPWMGALAIHHPAKVVLDLAVALALGGDALCDIAAVRDQPEVFGLVASDPTVSRTIATLAADIDRVETAVAGAVAECRTTAWALAGDAAPAGVDERRPLVVDIDATLVAAHSEKERAAPTWKKGYGFHPLAVFVDHGAAGTGEPLAIRLRPGNAGSNTAQDHIDALDAAIRSLPGHAGRSRWSKNTLVRVDGAGYSHDLINWCHKKRLGYSVGWTLPMDMADIYAKIPEEVWSAALDADGDVREGAHVAELTGLLDLTGWPKGMRVIVRRERPHPGAQLRFDDVDGYRLTAFATNTRSGGPGGQLQHLERRHRLRARCEDRIRNSKDTGLTNLPLAGFDQNRVWLLIVTIALNLTAWLQMIALTSHDARRWEPKKLRFRLLTIPATIAKRARRTILHLSSRSRWAALVLAAINRLRAAAT